MVCWVVVLIGKGFNARISNASRPAAMQRGEKNIDELFQVLNGSFHRLRQSGIDAELFDVISGFEALSADEE
ncbi:F0F1 ATP synthase subunit gamma [Sedimenticola selenatireducens]|uniref:F0F1 ATP synthase subunit gamma n=1 Tax=Sedimenticola selenatireducens TaxID=191960 RepID=UPI00048FF435